VSEGILLEPLARGTQLSEEARLARFAQAQPQILAILEGERDPIALQATLSCLLFELFSQASFVGFYRRISATTLAVGPYQGPMGCLRIELSRGVCGACASTVQTQRVPDVHAFPGHISCDATARSELVLPILAGREVRAVLDLDSRIPDAFSRAEAALLEGLIAKVFDDKIVWPAL
jgi:GAF domain-containing protein